MLEEPKIAFLRNAWYAAAWANEVEPGGLLPRDLLGEPVLLFRPRSGGIAAVQNWCPHRFAPLHLGKVAGDVVQCGYHGLSFDRDGACVANPQGVPPQAARLRSYPVREAHHLVWVWMGEATAADRAAIPDFAFLSAGPETARTQAYLRTAAHYELVTDNIMDLSHADFLHAGTLAAGSLSNLKPDVAQDGDSVTIRWLASRVPPSKLNAPYLPMGTMVDVTTDIVWTPPANMRLTIVMAPVGGGVPLVTTSCHILTPETACSTHYFHSGTRNFALDDPAVTEARITLTMNAFRNEDKPMIEAVQRVMGDNTDLLTRRPIMLRGDGAVARTRRILRRLLDSRQNSA